MQLTLQHFEVVGGGGKDPGKTRVCNVIRLVIYVSNLRISRPRQPSLPASIATFMYQTLIHRS